MNPKARQELIGIGALVLGVFLGLTLLPAPITGALGRGLGLGLWKVFGAGAVLIPVLGVGWVLGAFDRLGSLSGPRAAALGAGLVLLLPYGIGVFTGVGHGSLPPDYARWTASQRLAGLGPGTLASAVHAAVGTAGGILFGLFALSALGIFTVGWHPLTVLRSPETGNGKRNARRSPSWSNETSRRRKRHPRFPFPVSRGTGRDGWSACISHPASRIPFPKAFSSRPSIC